MRSHYIQQKFMTTFKNSNNTKFFVKSGKKIYIVTLKNFNFSKINNYNHSKF